jgi:hypothetical protein
LSRAARKRARPVLRGPRRGNAPGLPDECFFSVITRQAIRRGPFTSVKELTATIGAFIDHWNEHPRPFTWTKDADEILAKIERAKAKTSALTHH